jgi:ABC-type transport system involved in multi-copper enzyme maturation permease subunit
VHADLSKIELYLGHKSDTLDLRVALIMILGLGPVMRYELITTARRGRFYFARVAYGLFLLYMLWSEFREWERFYPGGGTIEQVYQFGESAFVQFAGAQGLTLLLLVPALVAGVIADEHQRKTLHYLLASRLSSAEIVLGKLGARLWHLGVFVALGLPVVSLLGLYGGINPQYVFHVYLTTFTTVLVVASLSILVSTLARRPREAIVATYGLEAAWIYGPIWISPFAHELGGAFFWVGPVNDWMMLSNPLTLWHELTWRTSSIRWGNRMGPWFFLQLHERSYWLAGLQAVFFLLFLTLAIIGLRPLRGSTWPGSQPKKGWLTRLREWLRALERNKTVAALTKNELLADRPDHPPCGNNPIVWKERYTTVGGGLRWLGGRPMVLFCSVLLGCYVLDVVQPVISRMFQRDPDYVVLASVNESFRLASIALAVLGMVAIASTAAVSLTDEREQDTWISLATTLLTPGEIVRGKQFGALWSARRIGLALLLLWSLGVVLRAIHPVGALIAVGISVLAAWFIAAIGVCFSTRARNSTRALTWTFIALFILLYAWLGVLWRSLFPYSDLAPQAPFSTAVMPRVNFVQEIIGPSASLAAIYGTVPLAITIWSIRRLRANWG